MEIKMMTYKNLPSKKYKLSRGATAITFRTTDGRVLKRYLDNEVYRRMIEFHNGDFLSFLIELDKLNCDLFVDIDEVFIGSKKRVGAMSYEYQAGTTIKDLYPKHDLIKLRNALLEADKNLRELEDLKLRDIHYNNILYTGDIKIIDTDFCEFTSEDVKLQNVAHVNNGVIRGLFDIDVDARIAVDPRLKGVFESTMNGETGAYEFLDEYMALEKKEKGRCQYYKHLSKDFIGERHGMFGRR